MPKKRVHCVNAEELEVLKMFGCEVADYSYYEKDGSKVSDFTIYYHGCIVGFEDSTYTEVTNEILKVEVSLFNAKMAG